MDKKALQLCAHFALQPNTLGYCGRDSAPVKLKQCIIDGNCTGIEKELKKFIVLNPYLQTIAEVTKLKPFDYKVIEAYWLGNDLLKQFKSEHYQILLKYFTKQGVPDWLISELKNKHPKVFIPIHLFNILHVGVGRASGSVPFNLQSINNCMLRWGRVTRVKSDKVKVISTLLVSFLSRKRSASTSGIYKLVEKEAQFKADPQLIGDLKVGDQVVVHWGWVAKRLRKQELINLAKWNNYLINSK